MWARSAPCQQPQPGCPGTQHPDPCRYASLLESWESALGEAASLGLVLNSWTAVRSAACLPPVPSSHLLTGVWMPREQHPRSFSQPLTPVWETCKKLFITTAPTHRTLLLYRHLSINKNNNKKAP